MRAKAITMACLVLLVFLCELPAFSALSKEEEHKILMTVIHKCELNNDEARLLFAIRQHENGPVGMEFGIGQDVGENHPARRYVGQPRRSLMIQAEWAAGTIKKRFNGSLKEFARVWCPKGPKAWFKSVGSILMTNYTEVPI